MHDELRKHAKEEEFDVANGEPEVAPVMPPLQNFQAVSVERDIAVKVLLVECLHRNGGPAIVLLAVLCLVELQVVFNWLAREFGLFVSARQVIGRDEPESGKNGKIQDNSEEYE